MAAAPISWPRRRPGFDDGAVHIRIDLRACETMAISLAEDEDRRRSISEICGRLGFDWRLVEAIKCAPGRFGCALSHLRCLRLSATERPLLILEDDIGVSESFSAVIEAPADADAIYLGASIYGAADIVDYVGFTGLLAAEPAGEDFFRVYNLLSTHAILYLSGAFRQAAAESILESLVDRDWEHDKGMVRLQERFVVYALRRPMFFQAAALQPGGGRHQEEVTNIVLEPLPLGSTKQLGIEDTWRLMRLVREAGQLRWRWDEGGGS
jgi:hypothetical protein